VTAKRVDHVRLGPVVAVGAREEVGPGHGRV
jgi:hypothetical protein